MPTNDALRERQKQLGEELATLGHAVTQELDPPGVLLHDLTSIGAKLADVLTQRLPHRSESVVHETS